MPQLTENKQNEPILIANFEPTHCARNSAQKVEAQDRTRRHCAGEPAQKVKILISFAARERELWSYGRGLFEDDLPGAVAAEAEAGAAVVVGKSVAAEGRGARAAVNNYRGVATEQINLNLRPFGVVQFVAGRENYSQDRAAVEDQATGGDVNVFGSNEIVHGGAVVFKPGGVPGFSEVVEFLTQRRGVQRASCTHNPRLSGLPNREASCRPEGRRYKSSEPKRRPIRLERPSLGRACTCRGGLGSWRLFEDDFAEQAGSVIVGACGEEKMVGGTVCVRSAAELNSPELVDVDICATNVLHCADELACYRIKGVDGAGRSIVGDEKRVAERPEIFRSDSKAPRLVQRRATEELLKKRSG